MIDESVDKLSQFKKDNEWDTYVPSELMDEVIYEVYLSDAREKKKEYPPFGGKKPLGATAAGDVWYGYGEEPDEDDLETKPDEPSTPTKDVWGRPKYKDKYVPPKIDIFKKASKGTEAGQKAKTIFYDFYAIKNLYDAITLSNMVMRPEHLNKLRAMYVDVTVVVARYLRRHLKYTLVQELRHLVGSCPGFSRLRQELVSAYNKSLAGGEPLTDHKFKEIVYSNIKTGHPDIESVKRILKFASIYSKMAGVSGKDPGELDDKDLEKEPEEPTPQPQPMPGEEPETPEEPGEPIEAPPFDDEEPTPSDFKTDPTYDPHAWYWDPEKKKKLTESGQLDPHTFKKLNAIVIKVGLTWEDIYNAYHCFDWSSAFGGEKWAVAVKGFLKLRDASQSQNIDAMAQAVDYVYDLVHNTGELFNKGGMYVPMDVLDQRAKQTSVARLMDNTSPKVKEFVKQFLRYQHESPAGQQIKSVQHGYEDDLNAKNIVASPTVPFTPEQEAALKQKSFYKSNGGLFVINLSYNNKLGHSTTYYYVVRAHTDGRFTAIDSLGSDRLVSDIQIFNNFDSLVGYFAPLAKDVVSGYVSDMPPEGGMPSTSYAPSVKSEKQIYLDSHSRIKLTSDKETALLYQAKMGWRSSKKYKAYFPGNKRFELYAFSDGTFLCTYNTSTEFKVFNTWEEAFNYCKTEGAKALDYPDKDGALAAIGTGGSGTVVTPAKTVVAKDYYLEPSELQTFQQLLSSNGPSLGTTVVNQTNNGMYGVTLPGHLHLGSTPIFSVGHKLSGVYGKVYKVEHQLPGGVPESWTFSDWKQTYDFLQKNLHGLIKNVPLSSIKAYSSTTTPLAYAPAGNLPDYSPSKASYKMHTGIDSAPKHTIRLTKEDEALLTAVGFVPKMLSGDVWYIHKTAKDTIKFYPNNKAKLLFTSQSSTIPGVNFDIDKMLVWVQKNYTANTTKSPLETGVAKPAPAVAGGGIQLGSMMEKNLLAAGFTWNPTTMTYEDSNKPGNPNTIVVKPNKSSVLIVKPNTAYNDEVHHFANLLDLMTYIKDQYPLDKKKSESAVGITKEALHQKLFALGYKTTLKVVPNGTEYLYPSNGSVIVLYNDGKSTYTSPASTIKHAFNTFQELSDYLDKLYPGGGSGTAPVNEPPKGPESWFGGVTQEEAAQLKDVVGKHGYISSWNSGQGEKGKSDYVAIYKKPADEMVVPSKYPLVYTVGRYSGYYQINDAKGAPVGLTDDFEKLKDNLEKLLDPKEAFITLLELLKKGGFQYVKGPSKHGGYEYANTKNDSFQYYPHNKTSALYDASVSNVIFFDDLQQAVDYLTKKYGNLTPSPVAKDVEVPFEKAGKITTFPSWATDKLRDLMEKGKFYYEGPMLGNTGYRYNNSDGDWITLYKDGSSEVYDKKHGNSIDYNNLPDLMEYMQEKYGSLTSPDDISVKELPSTIDLLGDLPAALAKGGFKYKGSVTSNQEPGSIYENDESGTRIIFYNDGKSTIYPLDKTAIELKTPNELVNWLIKTYGEVAKSSAEEVYNRLKQYGYQDYPYSNEQYAMWINSSDDHIRVQEDGHITINPSAVDEKSSSISIYLETPQQLLEYLDKKHGPPAVKLKQIQEELPKLLKDLGFKLDLPPQISLTYTYNHPQGSKFIIYPKNESFGIHVGSIHITYASITDAIYFLNQYFNTGGNSAEASMVKGTTGDTALDSAINKAGFKYHGQLSGDESPDILTMVFYTNEGFMLRIYDDKSSRYYWPATAAGVDKKSVGFNNFDDLKGFLGQLYGEKPTAKEVGKKEDYAIHYYDDLGPSQTAYSIRLTEEDEKQLKSLGWVWVPAGESSAVSAYVHKDTLKRLVFFNKSLTANKDKPTASLLDKGFHLLVNFVDTNIAEVIGHFKTHPEKMSDANPPGGKYSTHYYDEVGPAQTHYSIRLRKEDEQILEDHGFIWRPAHQASDPNWYQNTVSGDYLMFYNLSLPDSKVNNVAAKLTNKYVEAIASWNTIPEALKWVTENVSPVKGGNYSVHYYNAVGPFQESKTIRLTNKDEAVLLALGYKWVPSWVHGKPSAYVNVIEGKRIEFYNKNLDEYGGETGAGASLKNYEGNTVIMQWITIEEALTSLSEGKNKASDKSILTYEEAKPIINSKLPRAMEADKNLYDLITFTGEICVMYKGKLKFAIGKQHFNDDTEPSWYIRQVTSVDKLTLGEEIYTFYTANNAMHYVKYHTLQFLTGIPVKLSSKPQATTVPQATKIGGVMGQLLSLHLYSAAIKAGFSQVGNEQEGVVYKHANGEFSFAVTSTTIIWTASDMGTKEVTTPNVEKFLTKVLENSSPQMSSAELDKVFCKASVSRKEKIFDRMLRIARKHNGANMEGTSLDLALTKSKGFIWNDFDHVYMNERLSQVVVVTLATGLSHNEYHLYWIKVDGTIAHAQPTEASLMQFIGPMGSLNQYEQTFKSAKNLSLMPSGHLYKVHSNEANANRIQLNEHDASLLEKCGFKWSPSIFAYSNLEGDSFSFTDTDKAQYWNAAEFMGYGFDEISQALTFAIQKYITHTEWTGAVPAQSHSTMTTTPITAPSNIAPEESWGPFSGEAYDNDYPPEEDEVDMIDLNEQDTKELKKLGFEHNPKNHSYVKHIKKGETPNTKDTLTEVKKKKGTKKHIAKQFDLPLDDPEHKEPVGELDLYEVVYAFNTGNATWTLTDDPGPGGDETQTKDGTIKEILTFVWKRWDKSSFKTVTAADVGASNWVYSDDVSKKLGKMGFVPSVKLSNGGYEYVKEISPFTHQVQLYPPDKFVYTIFQKDPNTFSKKVFTYNDTIDGGVEYLQTHVHAPPSEKASKTPAFNITVEDAITFGGGNYMDAPAEWKQSAPYSPTKSSKSSPIPDTGVHTKLVDNGFVWADSLGIYIKDYADAMSWEAIKYEDGVMIYFYPATSWDMSRKYFVSKNFQAVLNKMHIIDSWKGDKAKKFWGGDKSEVPYSGFDYVEFYKTKKTPSNMSIQLEPADQKVMEDIGFKLHNMPSTSISYKYAYINEKDKYERMFFFAGGGVSPGASYWTDNLGVEKYFPTVKEAMQFLWDKYAPTKKKPTGEMPFSGFDYSTIAKKQRILPHVTIILVDEDEKVMKDMGFRKKFTDGLGSYYQKGIENIAFYANGTAKYWENSTTSNPPIKFSSVKSAMEKLWRKHAPYVEELVDYKDLTDLMMA